MCNIVYFNYPDERFEFVKAIRTAVFTNEQGADAEGEFDMLDRISTFALLYENGNAVGTARLVQDGNSYKIGRIAIKKSCRGKGYGALIVRAITERAFDFGAESVCVDAQNYAVPFYEKLGFRVVGTEIIDRGLPHIPMNAEKGEYYGKK